MSRSNNWYESFEREIALAQEARSASNEGRARVCARRAAGLVAGEYLRRQGLSPRRSSAYARLQDLADVPGFSLQAYRAIELLTLRVTTDWALPVDADLIAEAHRLRQELLGE
jgi:hypothetical protein